MEGVNAIGDHRNHPGLADLRRRDGRVAGALRSGLEDARRQPTETRLSALSYRLGATLAAGVWDRYVYDIGVPIVLIYWFA
jgi:hypothetical protein